MKAMTDNLAMDNAVGKVTTGKISEHQKVIGILSATDLSLRAGWGHKDSKGRVNPGKGLVKNRDYSVAEQVAIKQGSADLALKDSRAFELLGPPVDVYANEATCWRCVPSSVWEYCIGGYPVVKKWLSYREQGILGRPLTKDEAREVTSMVRRIADIVLMTDTLNSNYVACRTDCVPWAAAQ